LKYGKEAMPVDPIIAKRLIELAGKANVLVQKKEFVNCEVAQ
jgi:hypothetical protein